MKLFSSYRTIYTYYGEKDEIQRLTLWLSERNYPVLRFDCKNGIWFVECYVRPTQNDFGQVFYCEHFLNSDDAEIACRKHYRRKR